MEVSVAMDVVVVVVSVSVAIGAGRSVGTPAKVGRRAFAGTTIGATIGHVAFVTGPV